MKICCVYHSIDLDGWMSAAIVKHWFITEHNKNSNMFYSVYNNQNSNGNVEVIDKNHLKNELTFIGYNYGDPIPHLHEYDQIIMCDISLPKEEMLHLWELKRDRFIWIDHHISAILDWQNIELNDLEDKIKKLEGVRDTKFAACELTWKYFFPNEEMPEIVRLLGRYDCFGHKGTSEELKVLEFQYGARSCISNYQEAYLSLMECIRSNNKSIANMHDLGVVIYQYLCTEARHSYTHGFPVEFISTKVNGTKAPDQNGIVHYKFIAVNKERLNPINFGIDYHAEGYDGCVCFWYEGKSKLWKLSLYNDNGQVDCSSIAQQFGGGGHKGAAGFMLSNENFIKFISK